MDSIESWLAGAERRQPQWPLVSLCYAQSLDGSISSRRGQPLALSGPESLALTHRLRAAHDAILVGVGTVLADDPSLTVRLADGKDPQPVVLDSHLRLPLSARLLRGDRPLWIATTRQGDPLLQAAYEAAGARLFVLPATQDGRVTLPALLEQLAQQGVNRLMVEGGARVITSFIAQDLVDLVVLTIAPRFVGGLPAVEGLQGSEGESLRLSDVSYERLGDDLIVWGKLPRHG